MNSADSIADLRTDTYLKKTGNIFKKNALIMFQLTTVN
ncbi:hypothetical protein Cabys_3802 [Caldithrix abyssi DSM 13497]|uniref:Uncharacterized protein n=1 Tax=Caldithrix abyssi DSM 13497 TaxID=880073 RepID=A0A1J1CCW5_CALAY|nr:hypothetical protein Cabys_3802 [Caldithrix abyssi DSM 13497]